MKLISSILLLNAVNCMYFYLEPGTKKCIKECFTKFFWSCRSDRNTVRFTRDEISNEKFPWIHENSVHLKFHLLILRLYWYWIFHGEAFIQTKGYLNVFCETIKRKKFIRMLLLLANMKLPNLQTIRFLRIIFIPIWYGPYHMGYIVSVLSSLTQLGPIYNSLENYVLGRFEGDWFKRTHFI